MLLGAHSSIITWGSGSPVTQTMMLKPINASKIGVFAQKNNLVCLLGDLALLLKIKEQSAGTLEIRSDSVL